MRSMPPNAAPRTSGMINMHHQQPVHSQQAQPAAQGPQQQSHQQATGPLPPPPPPLQATANKHQQPKRVAVKLSTSRGASQEAAEQAQWAPVQPNHVAPGPLRAQPPPPPVSSQAPANFVPESPSIVTSGSTTTATVMVGGQQHRQCASSGSATISGLTNTINTTATSNTGGPLPPPPSGTGLIGVPVPMRDELTDDLSECSCSSNSLDCSLDDPSHSVSSQLDQPLLGGPGGMPTPGHHHHHHHHQQQQQQQPMANHYQPHNHQHHNPHHHQRSVHQQHQRGHLPAPPPPNEVYRGPAQHHHYYNKQQQHFHHPDHERQQRPVYEQHGRAPAHHQNQNQNQNQSHHHHHSHHHNHHRPLLPHASMPPSLSVAATPPPLFRHSTYAATSDTLTDESPHHGRGSSIAPYYGRPPAQGAPYGQVQAPSSATSLNARPMAHEMVGPPPPPPLAQTVPSAGQDDAYFSAGQMTNETDLLIGKSSKHHQHQHHHRPGNGAGRGGIKQPEATANFRRSATTREPDSHRWRGPDGSRQPAYSASDATNTLSLERNQQQIQADGTQSAATGGGGSLQRVAPSAAGPSQRSSSRINAGAGQKVSARHSRQQAPSDNGATNSGINQYQAYSGQQQQHQPNSRTQSSLEVNAFNGTGAHLIPPGGSNPNDSGNSNLLSASAPAMPHSGSPFEGAAPFCPPVLPALPPPPLPAIPSHRTNSPWMRLSGIILTPVGIVIVLFIVISPLLHYLM